MFDIIPRFVNEVTAFLQVEPQALHELENNFKVVSIGAKDFFLRKGEICHSVAFIEEGIFKLASSKKGKELIVDFYSEGKWISLYESYVNNSPSPYYYEAITDAKIVVLSYEFLERIDSEFPVVKEFSMERREQDLMNIFNRLTSLLLEGPEEQYRTLLKKHANLLNRLPQYLIASYLGVTDVGLSRIRKRVLSRL